jgi:hypothetical protein
MKHFSLYLRKDRDFYFLAGFRTTRVAVKQYHYGIEELAASTVGVDRDRVLGGDWNKPALRARCSRFIFHSSGQGYFFHPKYNEVCAALEEEFPELRGLALYRRDRCPYTNLPAGSAYIYSMRKEQKYSEGVEWEPVKGDDEDDDLYAASSTLILRSKDIEFPEATIIFSS